MMVLSGITEIFRIRAPDWTYGDSQMKEFFMLLVQSLWRLSSMDDHYYDKAVSMLETMAGTKFSLIMLDLNMEGLILEMFQNFLTSIEMRPYATVFLDMVAIMTTLMGVDNDDDDEGIPVDLLSALLASVKKDRKEASPVSWALGVRILEKSAGKVRPFLTNLVQYLGIDLNDYADVVASICQNAAQVENTMEQELASISAGPNGQLVDGRSKSVENNSTSLDMGNRISSEQSSLKMLQFGNQINKLTLTDNATIERDDGPLKDKNSLKDPNSGPTKEKNTADLKPISQVENVNLTVSEKNNHAAQDMDHDISGEKNTSKKLQFGNQPTEPPLADNVSSRRRDLSHLKSISQVENVNMTVSEEHNHAAQDMDHDISSKKNTSKKLQFGNQPTKPPLTDNVSSRRRDVNRLKSISQVESVNMTVSEEHNHAAQDMDHDISGEKNTSKKLQFGNQPMKTPLAVNVSSRRRDVSCLKSISQVENVNMTVSEEHNHAAQDMDHDISGEKNTSKELQFGNQPTKPPLADNVSSRRRDVSRLKSISQVESVNMTVSEEHNHAAQGMDHDISGEKNTSKKLQFCDQPMKPPLADNVSSRRRDVSRLKSISQAENVNLTVSEEHSHAAQDMDHDISSEKNTSKKLQFGNQPMKPPLADNVSSRRRDVSRLKSISQVENVNMTLSEEHNHAAQDMDHDISGKKNASKKLQFGNQPTKPPLAKNVSNRRRVVSHLTDKNSLKEQNSGVMEVQRATDLGITSQAENVNVNNVVPKKNSDGPTVPEKRGRRPNSNFKLDEDGYYGYYFERIARETGYFKSSYGWKNRKPRTNRSSGQKNDAVSLGNKSVRDEKPRRKRTPKEKSHMENQHGLEPKELSLPSPLVCGKRSRSKSASPADCDQESVLETSSQFDIVLASHLTTKPTSESKNEGKPSSSKEEASRPTYGEKLVGSKIKVWWPLDQQYYEGFVDSFDLSAMNHKVIYDDGDEEILNLMGEDWQLVKEATLLYGQEKVQGPASCDLNICDGPLNKKQKQNSNGEEDVPEVPGVPMEQVEN